MRVLLLAVATLLSLPALAAEKTWVVPSRVQVTGEELKLSDLVAGAPPAWAEVALGQAPRPGGERLLNKAWILQRARGVGADQHLFVPDTVVVERAGRTLGRDELERAVEEALNPSGDEKRLVRVSAVGLPGPVPEGDVTLRVLPPSGDLSAATTVWVEVMSGGKAVAKAWARVERGRSAAVLVLTRPVQRGEILRPGDVEARAEKAVRAQALVDPAQAVGLRAVRSLSAGAQLSGADVEEVPGVDKGQAVQLVARVGGVVATTTGKALERARVGEGVRVENVGSGKVLHGVLRETGVVEVRPEAGR